MDSAVNGRDADELAAMLQLDSSDNLFWRPVVLQDTDLDVGMQWCILQTLMRATGFSAPLVERLRSQWAVCDIGWFAGAALRRSSREMVDLLRFSRWAISVIDLPSARTKEYLFPSIKLIRLEYEKLCHNYL